MRLDPTWIGLNVLVCLHMQRRIDLKHVGCSTYFKNIVKYEVLGYFRILEKCLLRSQQGQGTDCWSSWARPRFGARPQLATDLATSVDKDLPPDSAESIYTVYTPGV